MEKNRIDNYFELRNKISHFQKLLCETILAYYVHKMQFQSSATFTCKGVYDVISVRVEGLDDMDDRVRRRVLADHDMFDRLHEDRIFVVDVCHTDADVRGTVVDRRSVVRGDNGEVVCVTVPRVVVQSPEINQEFQSTVYKIEQEFNPTSVSM